MLLTDTIITDVKSITFLPESQITFTDDNILDLMYKVLLETIYPSIVSSNQGYFIGETTATVPPTLKVQLPSLSINGGVDAILSNNNQLSYFPLQTFIGKEVQNAFTFKGNFIEFSNDMVGKSITIMFTYAPLQPVKSTSCATITQINDATNTLTFSSAFVPDAVNTIVSTLGDIKQEDATKISYTSATVRLSSVNSSVVVGDYFCPHLSSCVLSIPPVYKSALSQFVAHDIFKSLGDFESAKACLDNASQMIISAQKLISNRAEGKKTKVRQSLFGRR